MRFSGRVTIHSGATGSTLATIGGQFGEQFGFSLAFGGKVGATARIVIGAPLAANAGQISAGRAALYTTTGTFLRERRGGQALEHYGWSVGGNADVNGDGTPDVIAGAPDYDVFSFPDQGRFEVWSGSTGALLHSRIGGSLGLSLGYAVTAVADANGDGRADFAVGAPRFFTLDAPERGAVHLFSGANGALLHTRQGDSAGDHLGFALASVGDANGDGRGDYVAGAPDDITWFGPVRLDGSAFVFSGANGAQIATASGVTGGRLGFAVGGGRCQPRSSR